MAFSPDGKLAATAAADKSARIWDVANKRLVFVYRGGISLWTLARGSGTHVQLATPNVEPAGDAPPAWQPSCF